MTSTSNIAATAEHPFTRAGLGAAPFRVIGSAERTFQAAPGEPVRPGGCCKYCYQGIRYAAVIQSADGKVFDVGLDCVRKVDMASYLEAREYFRAERAEARRRAGEAAASERAASRKDHAERAEQIGRENEAVWRAASPELAAIVDALVSDDGFAGSFAGRLLDQVRHGVFGGEEYEERAEKLRGIHAERTASGYVGTVGKRERFEGIYLGRVSFETSFGISRIHKIKVPRADGSHALITWKSGGWITFKSDGGKVAKVGETLAFKATVKAHGDYRGQAQTEVSRLAGE